MITIACVLKSGGDFIPDHVEILKKGIDKYLTIPYKFICLTDLDVGEYDKIFLTEDLNIKSRHHNRCNRFSQIEFFRPNIFDTEYVFTIDLDVLILNSINFINDYRGTFCSLRDFYNIRIPAVGAMLFKNGSADFIWQRYKQYQQLKKDYGPMVGKFMLSDSPIKIDYFQTLWPEKFISYKAHCCTNKKEFKEIPVNAAIISYHGKPRPWDTDVWNDYRISLLKDIR